jgi:hypothetical protein
MGSHPTDAATMKSSSAGAQASDQALAEQAKQSTLFANQAKKTQFGDDGKSGTLGGFLDPSKLDVSAPTGTFGLQYKNFLNQNSKNAANARGAMRRDQANSGFGANAPAGFNADQMRRSREDQASNEGAAFTDFAGKSYQDALQKFWASNDALQGQGGGALSASIAGNQAAAGNYANLYDKAATPVPSVGGALLGSAISAGGQVGAASAGKKK